MIFCLFARNCNPVGSRVLDEISLPVATESVKYKEKEHLPLLSQGYVLGGSLSLTLLRRTLH